MIVRPHAVDHLEHQQPTDEHQRHGENHQLDPEVLGDGRDPPGEHRSNDGSETDAGDDRADDFAGTRDQAPIAMGGEEQGRGDKGVHGDELRAGGAFAEPAPHEQRHAGDEHSVHRNADQQHPRTDTSALLLREWRLDLCRLADEGQLWSRRTRDRLSGLAPFDIIRRRHPQHQRSPNML